MQEQAVFWRVQMCLLFFFSFLPAAKADVWSLPTTSGRYDVTFDIQNTVALGAEHRWSISTIDSSGNSANIEAVDIKGGMPAHSHGLPGQPSWKIVGKRNMQVESLRFHMPGQWFIDLRFRDENGWDSVLFNFHVDASGRISTSIKHKAQSARAHGHAAAIVWTGREKTIMASLALSEDQQIHTSKGNLQALGKALFADRGLSGNLKRACIDCHRPELYFTSDQISSREHQRADSEESSLDIKRDVISVVDSISRPWLNWDGRKGELWSHALLPLEIENELDNNRTRVAHYIVKTYRQQFANALGEFDLDTQATWPADAGPFGNDIEQANWNLLSSREKQQINTVFSGVGKALGAYQAQIKAAPGPFDLFARSLLNTDLPESYLSLSAQRGLRLFSGNKARCLNCHNNSALTNNEFVRVVQRNSMIDFGRTLGAQLYLHDEFNCKSRYSELSETLCQSRIRDARKQINNSKPGAFRVPGLRGLEKTAPYMHDGRFADLKSVISHYNRIGDRFGQGDLLPEPGSLSEQDQEDLIEFLLSLGSDYVVGESPVLTTID